MMKAKRMLSENQEVLDKIAAHLYEKDEYYRKRIHEDFP